MENKKYILFVFALLTSPFLFSQIVGSEEPKKDTENETKKPAIEKAGAKPMRELDNLSSIYFNTNWSNTSRSLKSNSNLFGEEIGKRSDEVNANFWSFGIGVRTMLTDHFRFSFGLGYLRNGEKYSYIGADSTFKYTTTYRYISMPLMLDVVYGKDLKFTVGAGVVPQMMISYLQDQSWTNSVNAKGSFQDKRKGSDPIFNPFVISAVVNAGVQYKYSTYWSIYFTPEARFQLPSTFSKTAPYIQKAVALGFNFGLSYQL
ncbi:MAG: hypothetical protein ACSHXL_04490 [Bacteroidota bacterium]